MSEAMANGIIKEGRKRPESYNPCDVHVRVTHKSDSRMCYAGLTRREIPRAFIPRFHTRYQRAEGCWLWMAGTFKRGYGMVNLGRFADGRQHTEYAHRVAYVLGHGPIPSGFVVMHACDNPRCVNPAHLSLGTQGDNVRDAAAKGHYSGPRRRKAA